MDMDWKARRYLQQLGRLAILNVATFSIFREEALTNSLTNEAVIEVSRICVGLRVRFSFIFRCPFRIVLL